MTLTEHRKHMSTELNFGSVFNERLSKDET